MGRVVVVGDGDVIAHPDEVVARLVAAPGDGDEVVDVWPKEDPDAKGVAWAESLQITELVGEFTTYFTPGQSHRIEVTHLQPGKRVMADALRFTADGLRWSDLAAVSRAFAPPPTVDVEIEQVEEEPEVAARLRSNLVDGTFRSSGEGFPVLFRKSRHDEFPRVIHKFTHEVRGE